MKKSSKIVASLIVVATLISVPTAVTLSRKHSLEPEIFFWTKEGLEQIPWDSWKQFSDENLHTESLYIQGFPYPGDTFTSNHKNSWSDAIGESSLEELVANGYITGSKEKAEMVLADYVKVPTLFSDPIVIKETAIDYRLQYAADIGSQMIGESAAKGRLVNPAGRRLREHFYRFPDQCDATPIALEVFLRLMM